MNQVLRLSLGLCALLLSQVPVHGQMPGPSHGGINAAMLKLIGEFTSFSSKAEVQMQDHGSKEPMRMMVDFAMLDGKVRMDLDIGTLKSSQIPAETIQSFKAAGLDKVVTIIRPQQKSALLIYPIVRSYVDLPMSREESADMDRKFIVTKSKLRREVIDGRSCDKTRVSLEADNGEKHEAIVWYAPALKNFPVKIQMNQDQMVVIVQYREVKLTKPEAKQFEVPGGFAREGSVEQLMQTAMIKKLGGGKSTP